MGRRRGGQDGAAGLRGSGGGGPAGGPGGGGRVGDGAAESVLMMFAAREPDGDFGGLPELDVAGLRAADARSLLKSVVRSPLDERVVERIVAETRGNPLALLELPRELSPAELAGGFGVPDVLSAPDRIEDSFLRRIEQLPE